MTWQWAIFSKARCLFPLVALACQLNAATFTGRVVLTDSNDSAVNRQENFSGIVVWLQPTDRQVVHLPAKHVQMVQKDKKFTPHIVAIATGSTVEFPNLDPIFHSAFSNFDGELFDLGLYSPGSSKAVRFSRPGIVRIFCNIHPSMSAIIVVLDSPYFATTSRDGSFSIRDVPPGNYELHFFHERATPETLQKLTTVVSLTQDVTESPPIAISEAGYLPRAHKNKYGRDYPPGADENGYNIPLK